MLFRSPPPGESGGDCRRGRGLGIPAGRGRRRMHLRSRSPRSLGDTGGRARAAAGETGRRQGFEDKSLDYYTELYDAFGDNADFLVAELDFEKSLDHINSKLTSLNPKSKQYEQQAQKLNKQKQIISELKQKINTEKILLACALILYTQDQATYLFGGSYTEFQKFSAAFLIQYHAMNCTLRRNIMSYNFLGITGVFDGSDGVLRFKQNFNGYIVRKMGTFRYYPQPLKYKLIQGLKKLLRRS